LANALEQCCFATHPFGASASHPRCRTLLGFSSPGAPSRRFALKAPGSGEDGVDRFLTWNLLFRLKDGTDYTPFLPAHVVLIGKTSAQWKRDCCNNAITLKIPQSDTVCARQVHVAVTAHPTMAWVIQQLREAIPFGQQHSDRPGAERIECFRS